MRVEPWLGSPGIPLHGELLHVSRPQPTMPPAPPSRPPPRRLRHTVNWFSPRVRRALSPPRARPRPLAFGGSPLSHPSPQTPRARQPRAAAAPAQGTARASTPCRSRYARMRLTT